MKKKRNSKVKLASRAERQPKFKLSFGKVSKGSVMLGTSLALLALVGIGMICPMVGEEANAVESVSSNQILASTSVKVSPMITIGIDASKFDLEVIPTAAGTTAVQATKLTVNTNNTSGYKVYMHTADGSGNLKNVNEGTIITSVNDNTRLADFADNTWGYYFDQAAVDTNSLYHPVGASSNTVIKDSSVASTAAEVYNLAIATKISASLPSGTYSNVLVISAITNPVEITSMDQLFFMQDITPELCANATLEQQRQLVDTRDGKSYWVAKLADGNCWMTQNLALDIVNQDGVAYAKAANDALVQLTSDNTNINKESTDIKSTESDIPTKSEDTNLTDTRSWNLGKYVYVNAESTGACPSMSSNDEIINKCSRFLDVSGNQWESETLTWPNTIDQESKVYDAHYLMGNYYQFNAAVAGEGGQDVAYSVVETSICPKNWELPLGKNDDQGFAGLLKTYGLESQSSNENYNIAKIPLSFVRDGFVDPSAGSLRASGSDGYYWSNYSSENVSTVSGMNAFALTIYPSSILPNYMTSRQRGLPIRCIAE